MAFQRSSVYLVLPPPSPPSLMIPWSYKGIREMTAGGLSGMRAHLDRLWEYYHQKSRRRRKYSVFGGREQGHLCSFSTHFLEEKEKANDMEFGHISRPHWQVRERERIFPFMLTAVSTDLSDSKRNRQNHFPEFLGETNRKKDRRRRNRTCLKNTFQLCVLSWKSR